MDGVAAAKTQDSVAVQERDQAVLDRARASALRRSTRWPPQTLSPGTRVLLWALRIYVVLMMAVVGVQIARLG
jgi:hypothetical protein